MNIEINKSHLVIAIIFLFVGLSASMFLTQINSYKGLLEVDRNFIAEAGYYSGHCERVGLVSNIYVQEDSNGNKYGVPICTQPVEIN